MISGANTEYSSVTVDSGGVLVLQGPVNVVVDTLDVQAGGELLVDNASGAVKLYSRSGVQLAAGSTTSTTSVDPWQLLVLQAADNPATPQVEGLTLTGNGILYGIINAPDAAVTLGANMELYGAVTGDQVALQSGAQVHVDVSTMAGSSAAAAPVSDKVLLWQIVSLPSAANAGGDPFRALGVTADTLAMPYDGHKDLWLRIDYLDAGGAAQTWNGWATNVDPTILRQVNSVRAYPAQNSMSPVFVKNASFQTTATGATVQIFN